MSYSNYEQKVVINGYTLSGVTSVDGNYGISEKPVRVAGVGFVDALIDSPLQGNFSINRAMVGHDPLLEAKNGRYIFEEQEIEGAILYDNDTKGFGFNQGKISRYSVSCSVGEIPQIQTDIIVYGELGSGVYTSTEEKEHPPIKFPDQSSIKINVSDFSVDAISDFSYSRSLNLNPLYAIPKGDATDWNDGSGPAQSNLKPVQIDVQYPIETDINFTMIADEYEIREIKDRIQAAPKSNLEIEIRDSEDDEIINSFTGKNVRLISESINSAVDGEMSISLTYKGYETLHNRMSL
tara:strand:- start:3223 stop:4104 length:882 start_codon:yes stop_codon:yes gene_type:complete